MVALFVASVCSPAGDPCREVLTFVDGNVPTREIFISPEGSDTSGAGTEAQPYRTLSRAAQGIGSGTAIRLLPGSYPGGSYLSGLAGSAEAPIWIGGIPGRDVPTVAGGGTALHLSRVRYLVVEHLEISGATVNGINCDDGGDYANPETSRFVLFRNLNIHDIGTGGNNDCLKLSGLDDYWVLDCTFANGSAGGSGIDHVGCHRGVVASCSFADMGSNAIQCKGGSEDIEILGSHFQNGGARAINIGGSTGFEFFRPPLSTTQPNVEARDIRVVANVFEGSDAPVAFVGSTDCLVAHNTFVDPTRWVLRILQESTSSGEFSFRPCGNGRFINNLVYFSRSQLSTFVNIGPNTAPETFIVSHNFWYAHDQPTQSTPTLPVVGSNPVTGQDPKFVDGANGNFNLSPGSPAVGQGLALPEAPVDCAGKCFANPPSIGAFEANPGTAAHSDADPMPDWWEDHFGLDRLDPLDATLDPDADGAANSSEYLAGTDPTDPNSLLRIVGFGADGTEFWVRFATPLRVKTMLRGQAACHALARSATADPREPRRLLFSG